MSTPLFGRLGWRVHHWIWPVVWWARRKPRSDFRQMVWSWADYLDMRFRVMPRVRQMVRDRTTPDSPGQETRL